MKKIAITGSNGIIGTVLRNGLNKYKITSIDLPEYDVRKYQTLLKVLPKHDSIIHLAWNTKTDNVNSNKINPDNSLMFFNVYRAALELKIPRVILASSVHAVDFYNYNGPELLNPYNSTTPDSPYGAHKVFMEVLGKYYSEKGLEVICIRFGGVDPENKPSKDNLKEQLAFLSYNDCVSLLEKCIETKEIPNRYCIIYGVSNNTGRIHNISNPVGWVPRDDYCDLLQ